MASVKALFQPATCLDQLLEHFDAYRRDEEPAPLRTAMSRCSIATPAGPVCAAGDQPGAVAELRRQPRLSIGFEILAAAFDAGITHFDLANNCGPTPGSAEAVIVPVSVSNLTEPRINCRLWTT